jgi:hypothetical protein
MAEEVLIEQQVETPPQQPDPPIKKLYQGLNADGKYTKSFDEFKKQYSSPEAIDKLYNGLKEDGDYTKTKEDFQSQYFSEPSKKKVGGKVGSINYELSSNDTKLPLEPQLPLPENNEPDVIAMAQESGRLRNKTINTPNIGGDMMGTSTSTSHPDAKAIEDADKIDKMLSEHGYDANKLREDFKDVPDDVFMVDGFRQSDFLQASKENKPKYERMLATAKWQSGLKNELYKQEQEGNVDGHSLFGAVLQDINTLDVGDYNQQRDKVKQIANIVNQYGGEDKEKIMSNLAVDMANVYGKGITDIQTIEKDPLAKDGGLNNVQVGAYHLLEDTNPTEANKYKAALIPDADIKDNTEAQIAKQEAGRRLEEIGNGLAKSYAQEHLNPILKEYTALENKAASEGLTPEEQGRVIQLEQEGKPFADILQDAKDNEQTLSQRYPKTSYIDANNFAQELIGQKHSGLDWGLIEAGKATENTAKGVVDFLKRPFLSDQANEINQAEILGSDALSQNSAYLKQSNQTTKQFKPELTPELQSKVDAIKNNDALSNSEKQSQVTDLLMSNTGQWRRTPIEGGETNIGLTSLMYGVGGLAANLAPFMAAELVTGGGASAGALRKFTSAFTSAAATGFHDSYVRALESGSANPYADAIRITAINSAALAGADAPAAIKKMLGDKTAIGKLVSKMTDKEINEALKQSPKALTAFSKSLQAAKKAGSVIGNAAATGFKTGAKVSGITTVGQVVNDVIDNDLKSPMDYAKQAAIETLKFTILGTGLGTLGKVVGKPTDINLAAISEAGKNPEAFTRALETMEKNGSITPEDAAQVRSNIEKVSKIFKESPILKNKDLSENDKREYVYNELVKRDAKDAAATLSKKQADIAEHTALVADFKNDLIIDKKSDKQLDARLSQIEKQLEPKTDDNGKSIELPEKEKKDLLAEQEAITKIQKEFSDVADKRAKELRNTSSDVAENRGNSERISKENEINNETEATEKPEQPVPITTEETSTPKEEVVTEIPTSTKGKEVPAGVQKVGKYEAKARVIADKINAAELPDWMKINDKDVKKSGVGVDELKKSLADATIKMGKLLDKGVEFADAVKEAVKDMVDLLGEDKRGIIEKGFADDYKKGIGNEDKSGVKKSITSETRSANGLPKVEFPKMISDVDALNAAKERVDNGEVNPQDLVDRILEKKEGYKSEDEVMDMQYYAHQLNKKSKELSEQLTDTKTPEEKLDISSKILQLSDLIDAQTEAAQTAGNQWGKIGNRMQPVIMDAGQIFRDNKLAIKEAYGGEIPKEVQEKISAIEKERDEAIAQRNKVEELLKQKMAKEGFDKLQKQAQKESKNKSDKEALKKEEQDLLKELKQSLKKDLGNLNSGIPIPTATLETLGKLAINYLKQGVNGLEALTDRIYESLKDDIKDISRKDIRDAIANYEPLTIEQETKRLNKKAEILEDKLTPPVIKTTGNNFKPSEPTNFGKPSKIEQTFRKNNEWVKANQRVANAEFKMKIEKRKAFESQKNFYQRALMWFGRLTRLSVLSGYNVLGKLAAAATIGSAVKRIPEQAIGAVYSKIFSGIAKKAPMEGQFNWMNAKSEARFYREFFHYRWFKSIKEILSSGSTSLGKRLGSAEYEHVPILYLPTDLHQIIKDPPKRATFEASFRNGLIWAEKNGLDINDPLVINSLENAAYKRAMYEIFQEENWLSKKFTSYKSALEKAGNTGATAKMLVDFMIPVSTVPTNIVRRVVTTSPLGLIRGGKEVVEAYRKGIEKLTPDEADHVMKQLKQGSLGTALWLIGWFGAESFGGLYSQFNPNKKREEGDKESDVMEIGGQTIPKPAQHALPLEVIQFAATARRIYDNYRENKNASVPEAIYKAGLGSIGAGLEQVPVISTGVHAVMSTKDPVEAEKLKEDVTRRFEPQILRETGVIGKKVDTNQPEWKLIDDKGLKVVDIHKEALHPLDKKGNKVEVTDELFDQVKQKREENIQEAIKQLMKKGGNYTDDNGNWKTIKPNQVKDLSKSELRSWLMKASGDAKDKAIEQVFGAQPEVIKKTTLETNF